MNDLFDPPGTPLPPPLTVSKAIELLQAGTPPTNEALIDLLQRVQRYVSKLKDNLSMASWDREDLHDRMRAESDERIGRMGGGG